MNPEEAHDELDVTVRRNQTSIKVTSFVLTWIGQLIYIPFH